MLFQFTPPRGGRRIDGKQKSFSSKISIHAPAWRATPFRWSVLDETQLFQFTPPRGGRRSTSRTKMQGEKFQFTPPRGGRPPSINTTLRVISNFNSRPRVGGDQEKHRTKTGIQKFQFTPPRGGRPAPGRGAAKQSPPFQFTPPRGGRPFGAPVGGRIGNISIHAPAWGATYHRPRPRQAVGNFNSRPRVGGDNCGGFCNVNFNDFNSRPRVGGDWGARTEPHVRRYFNSRPRVGGDFFWLLSLASKALVFQFTPPRGGRPCRCPRGRTAPPYFNSRPRVGGDPRSSSHSSDTADHFNSRPRVGGDA